MKTSSAGRLAIRAREGEVLHSYRDTRGIMTCCVGHTGRTSPPTPRAGETFTKEQADAFLAADLAPVEAAIAKSVKVPLSQNQFDSLASLGFNIGVGGLTRSTVISRLNRGDGAGAAQAFLLWAHPAELMGRRKAEGAQFLEPDPGVSVAVALEAAPEPAAVAPVARAAAQVTSAPKVTPLVVKPGAPAPAAPSLISRVVGSLFG